MMSSGKQTALFSGSLVGIGVVAALLTIALVTLYGNPAEQELLPAVVATVCPSLFWWWWFNVRPRRVNVWLGLLTGGVSAMSAIPLWVGTSGLLQGVSTGATGGQILFALGYNGLTGIGALVALLLTPVGWGLVLFGSFVGSLAALTLLAGLRRLEESAQPPMPPGRQQAEVAEPGPDPRA